MNIDSTDTPAAIPEADRQLDHQHIVAKLSTSRIYQDYQKAFYQATGLALAIRPVQSFTNALAGSKYENPFCALVAQTSSGCTNCLQMQARLEQEAGMEPRSLHCFAGLCDTAVPIRVGNQLIAFLQTGQILLHQPNQQEFTQATQQLLSWGSDVDLRSLEEAYFQTRVFNREQYEAMIRLLSTFAEHLAAISNSIAAEPDEASPTLVINAKKYIRKRYQNRITLTEAARAVNASTRHFCKVFKQATGITFVEYLTRLRVEKAKHLLQNPNLRVSEIAFNTGFDSLSQFNRSFKRLTSLTPTQFRRNQAEQAGT